MKRTARTFLEKILKEWGKMAFLSGPRQVGKTTLTQQLAAEWGEHTYFNWDVLTDQQKLVHDPYFFEKTDRTPHQPHLVILDELHKYARWKNYLKGAFDQYHKDFRFILTGSGRLDLYKKGGDSLLGRYFSLPLFPLTVGEVLEKNSTFIDFKTMLDDIPPACKEGGDAYSKLFHCSGFPDPFLKGEEDYYRLWFQERKSRLIREDIRDASHIREISLLETLGHLIPGRIGAPLSINSLKEDVGVAFETVRDWVELLSSFYYLFKVPPYTGSLKRSLRKETKVYLYDWVEVTEEAFRFENLVALHLLKAVKTWTARGEGFFDLYYVRDKEKREVDFLITAEKKPCVLIECKWRETEPAPSLLYFQEKLKVPVAVQLVHQSGICQKRTVGKNRVWIISANYWLQLLP